MLMQRDEVLQLFDRGEVGGHRCPPRYEEARIAASGWRRNGAPRRSGLATIKDHDIHAQRGKLQLGAGHFR